MSLSGREKSTSAQRKVSDKMVRETRIPLPGIFRRSASLRLRGEKVLARSCPPAAIAEDAVSHSASSKLQLHSQTFGGVATKAVTYTSTINSPDETAVHKDDDLDSLNSFGSVCSTMSCDHAYFARNGTTFSGRRMKYVVHCSPHSGDTEEYLTPTQRANKQIRRLKMLLSEAKKDLERKDQDIFRLTKEVVELRLYKASLSDAKEIKDPSESVRSTPDNDAVQNDTRKHEVVQDIGANDERCSVDLKDTASTQENIQTSPALLPSGRTAVDLPSSLTDSGHFEDVASSSSVNSKESLNLAHSSSLLQPIKDNSRGTLLEDREGERTRIVCMYEKKLDELQRNHVNECQEIKERNNDKVESILQRLSDVNNRYCELRTEYDRAQDKIRELEKDTESLRKSMEEQEERHKSMYLKMYMKGQEAARFEHADQVLEFAHRAPSRVSVPELLQQLQITENELENIKAMYRRIMETQSGKSEIDPEITLQFLKSAIYYFLTDKENHQGHLNAIESILGYNENERLNIEKAYKSHAKK